MSQFFCCLTDFGIVEVSIDAHQLYDWQLKTPSKLSAIDYHIHFP
jgi:hypothetical protein